MTEQDRAAYRDTALKVLVLGVSGVMAYLASTSRASPRMDYMVVTWLAIISLAVAAVGAVDARGRREAERARADRHDALVDSALKVLLRQKLVSEHDRLVCLGDADDTQRRAWMDSYETYEALCDATSDHNGVVDAYKQDVLDLPPWDGRGREKE
jgi:hypothetical protein